MPRWLNYLLHFPGNWYIGGFKWFLRLFKNLIIFLDNKLAVSLMLQLFFTPLFQDVSFLGRILSLIFRLTRTLFGLLIILLTSLSALFYLLIWLSLPFLGLIIFGRPALWIILSFWLIDFLICFLKPLPLPDKDLTQDDDLSLYALPQLKNIILKSHNDAQKFKALLLKDDGVNVLLDRLEITPQTIKNMPQLIIVTDWLFEAHLIAKKLHHPYINPQHCLIALLKFEDLKFIEALSTLKWLKNQSYWRKTAFIWDQDFDPRPMGGVNRGWTDVPTPTLDRYSTDLTKKATTTSQPELIGKQQILNDLFKILSRQRTNNAVIIGEPGCGKTTLMKGLAQEIIRGVKVQKIRFKRLVSLDASKLAAGADSGELNTRITKIIAEIEKSKNIILFVDEIHHLSSINDDLPETSDLFTALEPPLSDGLFQFVGATTTKNFKKFIEPNQAFARLFETVTLKEPSKDQTLNILQYVAYKLETQQKVTITTMALKTIIDLADQLIHDRVFPDKAISLLDEVVAQAQTNDQKLVTSVEVQRLVSQKTNVPLTAVSQKESSLLLNLEKKLHQQIIGQQKAIKAIADAVRRARTGARTMDKPIASFMFAGPTGVGKTETAKALAEQFFGSQKVMIRLDMSEYQTQDSLKRLIGSSSDNLSSGGQLTEAVRKQPYSLILLDEFEKAHPDILNIFLQVLDDARLTDAQGKLIDFHNTIIIATTNVGTPAIIKAAQNQISRQQLNQKAMQVIETHYRPELLNRFSGIIIFEPLNQDQVQKVVKLKLDELAANLFEQQIKIQFDDHLIKAIAQRSFSQKWGGRQIERVIQDNVQSYLAKQILLGKITKRSPITLKADILDQV